MSQRVFAGVSPALEKYEHEWLMQTVWARPALSRRDRSIVTVAALITRGQMGSLPFYAGYALDQDVTPKELSEVVAHIAFYAGWENAKAAAVLIEPVFLERAIGSDQLPSVSPSLRPIDEPAEERRAKMVDDMVGPLFSSLTEDTAVVLFRDIWLRPDLAPRDRSLVTVTTLITSGQTPQLGFHLGKAMDNGLTPEEAAEVISHLAYYAGWPYAMAAATVLKAVAESRAK
jgi:4-carboxymuconolactone decarboxylase